jgi:A/G-specific adenine glycosylase
MNNFSRLLIAWQRQHGRHDLPWQGGDAYAVWVSEIMLQQTQVVTVIPYFLRFMASFQTVAVLAAASEEQVLAHWSGLGYYARGRNLHRAARLIVDNYHGEFPQQFSQLIELPGIGRSTAAAICALAYHQRCAILDGNVKRLLARHGAIDGWTGDKKVEAQLWQMAEQLLPPEDWTEGDSAIAIYTQALMDMGATICTRSQPKCTVCPVATSCLALATQTVQQLPTPRPRKIIPERHAVLLLLMVGDEILLEKRPSTGVWGGLWSLPQYDDELSAMAACAPLLADNHAAQQPSSTIEALPTFLHVFTHFKLHINPWLIQCQRKSMFVAEPGTIWLSVNDALNAAIPKPVRTLLQSLATKN